MRVAITGSNGLIGRALIDSLTADGHEIVRIVRDSSQAGEQDAVWDVKNRTIGADKLEGVDAVVHLAGEPIGDSRWSDRTKREIHHSRLYGTKLIAETLAGLQAPPKVFLSGSAVGFYGDRGSQVLTEDADPGEGFLADVCRDWEAAAQPAVDAGIRTAWLRTGVTIAEGGPLIDKIELPFKLGVGGKVGGGRQYVPWIALEDHLRAMRFLLESEVDGPVNLTAPEPVTNAELTKALGKALNRPTILPIPTFAVTLLYGEMGRVLATSSQRAVPQRLLDEGFEFTQTDLTEALTVALND